MKSILIYSSEFLPFKGGVARYTEDMASMLANGGFARVVVFTETQNREGFPDDAQPYRVVRVPLKLFSQRWLNFGINALSSLAFVIRARLGRSEWVVAAGKRSVNNVALFRVLLGKTKLAVVLHGSEWWDLQHPKGWRRKALRRAVLRLCASADVIIISNRFTAGRFKALLGYPRGKTQLLHPVINPDRLRLDDALIQSYRRKYFSEHDFSLITVARLTPRKGQDQVLKALGRMAREAIKFRYFIVGTGWYKDSLERLIHDQGLADRVVILDGLGDTEAYSLLSLCDLFVMPNREYEGTIEGFGIAFLEANVLAVPVLAGKSGGSTEAVQDGTNGLVCDGDDPEDVYRKIRLYHDDLSLRARLKSSCRDHALQRFSFAKWKTEYQAVFVEPICRDPIA